MFEMMMAGLWAIFWKYAAAIVAVLALGAAAWAFPSVRKGLVICAFAVATHTIAYTVGLKNGESRVRAQWAAAQRAEIKDGTKARSDAERRVGDGIPEWVRDDPRNRDTWPKQGTEP